MTKLKAEMDRSLRSEHVLVLLCLLTAGCSKGREPVNEKPVSPVSGIVHVDGAPLEGVKLQFHAKTQEDTHRVFPKATTDAEGHFEAWTYRKGDGLATGEYTITLTAHDKAPPFTRESQMPDLLGGKYSNPQTSEFKVIVPDSGEPVEVETIELSR
ncbi:MAG: hypothetical protein R3B91_10840 [Planctomycetaceae bacterium]